MRQIWLERQPGRQGWEARRCLLRSHAEFVLRLVVDQGAVGSKLDAALTTWAAAEALPLHQPRHSPAGRRHVILYRHGCSRWDVKEWASSLLPAQSGYPLRQARDHQ